MPHQFRLAFIFLTTACMLSACIHPISKESRSEINPELRFEEVSKNPASFYQQKVLVGGLILSHEIKDKTHTLELLHWHINRWGEPTILDDSGRRFLLKTNKKLDPSLYEAGRLVTLAGEVHGQEERILESLEYQYPVLDLLEIHLWKSPFRYGLHHYDPAHPHYVGSEDDDYDRHPYDPGYSGYPYTPYWYRDSTH